MPEMLNVADLPSLRDFGFTGGRDSFKAFCRNIFSHDEPRFLRNDQNQLVVFRHEDLQALGTAPEIGNLPIGKMYPARFAEPAPVEKQPGWNVADVISSQVFTFNPPLHGPARQILTTWLGPKQLALVEDRARHVAQEIIDRLQHDEEVDFVSAIAERLTVGFWSSLLDLTSGESDAIGRCAREMTRLFHLNRDADDLQALDQAFAEYAGLLERAAERGLKAGNPTLIEIADKLAAIRFEDDPFEVGVAPKSVGELLAGNLVDGFHTAALASANTFHVLSRHPGVLEEVRASPQLAARAIAEALRLEPPIIFLKRYALQDFSYRNRTIAAGSVITMLWAAGNHDPSAFPEPERFDLHRLHTGLTTFGKGIHICPGRHVGVMLIRVLLETFMASGVEFEPASESAQWLPDHMLSQIRRMPVTIRKQHAR